MPKKPIEELRVKMLRGDTSEPLTRDLKGLRSAQCTKCTKCHRNQNSKRMIILIMFLSGLDYESISKRKAAEQLTVMTCSF